MAKTTTTTKQSKKQTSGCHCNETKSSAKSKSPKTSKESDCCDCK